MYSLRDLIGLPLELGAFAQAAKKTMGETKEPAMCGSRDKNRYHMGARLDAWCSEMYDQVLFQRS